MDKRDFNYRLFFSILAAIFLITIVISGGVLYLFYRTIYQNELNMIKAEELQHISLRQRMIESELDTAVSDLMIQNTPNLLQYVPQPDNPQLKLRLQQKFLRFAEFKPAYDQIRVLDEKGKELIRINATHEAAVIVPDELLQDKSNRYYFLGTIKLHEGEIFMSPLDLNIEHEQIELPLKPIIRFATPIYGEGTMRGIIILNLLAYNLLNATADLPSSRFHHEMILNTDGYFLKGYSPEVEWGFMYEDGEHQEMVFGKYYPHAWDIINNNDEGQFLSEEGLFTYKTFYPVDYVNREKISLHITAPKKEHFWKLIAYGAPSYITGRAEEERKNLQIMFFILGGAGLLFGGLFAWLLERKSRGDKERMTILGKLESRNRQITSVHEMIDYFQVSDSIQDIYSVVTRKLQSMFPIWKGALHIYHEKNEAIETVISWGGGKINYRNFPLESCWALRRGTAHMVFPGGESPRCSHLENESPSIYLCVPILVAGKILGVISMEGTDEIALLKENERNKAIRVVHDYIASVTEHLGLAIANLQLRDHLKEMSFHDALTGLYNRRYLEDTLDRELKRASRENLSFGIIMIDIDHFKNFNDTHGHEAGDLVLKKVGGLILEHIRLEDIPCRYGGEEFLIVLVNATKKTVLAKAESLRTIIEDQGRILYNSDLLQSITISIGVALFPRHGSSVRDLINAADNALYRAKKDGRNRVKVFGDP